MKTVSMKTILVFVTYLLASSAFAAQGDLTYDEGQSLQACAVQLNMAGKNEFGENSAMEYLGSADGNRYYQIKIKGEIRGFLRINSEEVVQTDAHGKWKANCG